MKFYKHKLETLVIIEKIVTIHFSRFPKDFIFNGEAHDFWEIVYADKGEVICNRGDGEDICLAQGNIIFHKPNEFHKIRAAGKTPPQVLIITFVCKSSAISFFSGKQFKIQDGHYAVINALITEAKNTFRIYDFKPELKKLETLEVSNLGGQQMIRTYLEQLLILMMRDQLKHTKAERFVHKNSISSELAGAVIKILEKNIYEKMSLDKICKQLNYGKTFLCTNFKAATGRTIIDYFIRLKIEESKKLLKENKSTVKEIAYTLGFESPAFFISTFKRITSLTPREYWPDKRKPLPV